MTIAIKDQFKMAYNVMANNINFGPLQLVEGTSFFIKLGCIPFPNELISADENAIVQVLRHVTLGKTKIKSGSVLIIKHQTYAFNEVRHIIKSDGVITFIAHTYRNHLFDEHLDSYIVDPEDYDVGKCWIEDISNSPSHIHNLPDGRKAISIRN